MALQSQAPRPAASRRYTSSSRKKKGVAPWLALVVVFVIIGGLYFLFADDKDPANAASPDPNTTGNTPATAGQEPAGSNPGAPTPPPGRPGSGNPPTNNGKATTGGDDRQPRPPFYPGVETEPQLEGQAKDQYEDGMQQLESGDVVAGRALLSELLFREGSLPRHEAKAIRERLANLSERMIFSAQNRSSEEIARDPILALHKVQRGEYLSTIANIYRVPYQLIERINDTEARKLQAGQGLQIIRGPVHARVDKSDYRMDLFVFDPDGNPIYLKSYQVGLGEFDSTPVGKWVVKPGSKVGPENGGPSWRNPRTGKVYDRNDPDIPIGEYWMALQGTDENTKDKQGYGIHATNDPSSIGRQESMGCIRMSDDDVDQVFYTLFEGSSVVEIVP